MSRKSIWGEAELKFIVDNSATMKDKDVAVAIGDMVGKPVSVQSVRKQRQKLHIVKESGRGKCAVKSLPVEDTSPVTPQEGVL